MKQGDCYTDDMRVAEDAERVLVALKTAGPQDLYQLSEDHGDLELTKQAVGLLIEKEVVEERSGFMPNLSSDPFANVYGVKINTLRKNPLRGW